MPSAGAMFENPSGDEMRALLAGAKTIAVVMDRCISVEYRRLMQ